MNLAENIKNDPQFFDVVSSKKRFINLIVDSVFCYLILLTFSLMLDFSDIFTMISVQALYYLLSEYFFGQTLGKFVTKTKVVCVDGKKQTLWLLLKRTICRYIPLEAFSYLKEYPIGLHDSLSGTLVVPKNYSPDNVKSINLTDRIYKPSKIFKLTLKIILIPFFVLFIFGIVINLIK